MATLTGKIIDVTNKPPERISSITVKAPSARVGSGSGVVTSSPATVDFNRATGDITISGLTGGLSWLYIEGDGWSDSIALSVAEGMITLVEAIANAAGAPGMSDYVALLVELESRIDDLAQNAIDDSLRWFKGMIPIGTTSLDQLDNGLYFSNVPSVATAMGLPAHPGALTKMEYGVYALAWYTSWSEPTRSWVAVKGSNGWSAWRDSSGRTQRLDAAWTSLDDVPEGVYFADNVSLSNSLGLPVTHGLLRVNRGSGAYGMATMTPWHDPTDEWVSERGGSGWGTWRKRDWGVTEQLRDEWAALDEVPDGVFFVDSTAEQSRLGLPAAHGTLEVRTAKPFGLAIFKGWDEAGRTWVSERQTIGWRDWKPERLKLVDATTNSRNVIEVDHYGSGYGLDIQNYPGAEAAVVLHNYTGDGEAVIIDNCDNQPAVSIYNTINTGITPNNIAKGDFIQFSPWSDIQRKVWKARLTNDLTLKNDTEHPLSLQRVDEALVGSRTQDDIVLQIKDKAGAVTASIHSDGRVSDRYTRHGEGMPEGRISAPVGATYIDTAATNGAIRWVKTSGTGNTGWRVEYGDTGIRNITSLIAGDQGTGTARIQRIGNTVMLAFNNIPTPGEGSYMNIPNFIPVGFRSAFNWQYLGTGKPAGIDATGPVRVGMNGDLYIYRSSSETRINGTVTYISNTPWPTTLPGTPA